MPNRILSVHGVHCNCHVCLRVAELDDRSERAIDASRAFAQASPPYIEALCAADEADRWAHALIGEHS